MQWSCVLLSSGIFFTLVSAEVVRFSLESQSNIQWGVRNENKSISVAALVPGGIYTDLQAAGILQQDLFYRTNDQDYRWVAHDNWTYSTTFSLPGEVLDKNTVLLVFDGLDTVADLYLNKVLLTSVDNMFVRHVVSIKNVVQAENNQLVVKFTSPVAVAEDRFQRQAETYVVPPKCVSGDYHGECHANHIRKMQASFAWDWGPAFPSSGIWKPVAIEAFNSGIIRDVTVETNPVENGGDWNLNVTAFVESASELEATVEIELQVNQGRVLKNASSSSVLRSVEYDQLSGLNTSTYQVSLLVPQVDVNVWWPNGFGNASLHGLSVQLVDGQKEVLHVKTLKVGFRTFELVQEDTRAGQPGKSFYFKVNGVPIFVKGSNWIPAHVLPELGYKEETVRHLLDSARDTHQNILRVWGGGVYESDLFYSIADEYGLMIWQDMMFACSMYPATPPFLESAAKEVTQQVRRLQHHASIALWAGNNENEAALRGNWYWEYTFLHFERYRDDYVKLYVDNLKPIFADNDRTRAYLISSPSNGVQSEEEGYIAQDPYDARYGDIHHYNYLSDPWEPSNYPYTRMASEYGFQAWPSVPAMEQVTHPDDRSPYSTFFSTRQHLTLGNVFNLNLINRHMYVPALSKSIDQFYIILYYSQIVQAIAMKTETEKYRRDRSVLTEDNMGLTMGAMYWQLNDVWQAPTWSSIEFGGRWKMLHYFVKKFFSPVLVSPFVDEGYLKVHLISDLLEDVPEVTLKLTLYSWNSFEPKCEYLEEKHTLLNASSTEVFSEDMSAILNTCGCTEYNCFVWTTLTDKKQVISQNFLHPASFKSVENFQDPVMSITNPILIKDNTVSFTLNSDNPAACVWLEADVPGVFSDNGFHVITPTTTLNFTSLSGAIDLEFFTANLTVKTVYTPLARSVSRSNTPASRPVQFSRYEVYVLRPILSFLNAFSFG